MKLAPGTAVKIRWVDAKPFGGWVRKETEVPLGKVTSIGFVVRSDREKLTLTTSKGDNLFVYDPLSIPWAVIKTVRVL